MNAALVQRSPLPTRRPSDVLTLELENLIAHVHVGYWPDGPHAGHVGELFIVTDKPNSATDRLLGDIARIVSKMLQSGASVGWFADAVGRADDGKPTSLLGLVLGEAAKLEKGEHDEDQKA